MHPIIRSVSAVSRPRVGLPSENALPCRRMNSSAYMADSYFESVLHNLRTNAWDVKNRLRVSGSILGMISGAGMLFDTFYRRATKTELKEGLQALETRVDTRLGQMDVRLGQMDTRLGQMDTRIGQMDEKNERRFEKMEAANERRFEKMEAINEKQFEQNERRFDQLGTKIDSLVYTLLHTTQRDKLAAEAENQRWRREEPKQG